MNKEADRRLELLCRIAGEQHSLQEIVNIAYELFENPLHITDMSRTVLVYTNCVPIENAYWQQNVVQNNWIPETPQQVRDIHQVQKQSIQSRLPMTVQAESVPYPSVVKTLLNEAGYPIGVVFLSQIHHPLTAGDEQYLELLSTYLVRQLEREKYVLRSSDRQAENFIIKLLDGTVDSEKQVQVRLSYLKWTPKEVCHVLVLQEDGSENEEAPAEHILDAFGRLPHSRAVLYDGRIVLVYSRETPVKDWAVEERELLSQAERWHMRIGLSRPVSRLCSLREAYLEARTALRLAHALGDSDRLCDYTRYAFYHLLENLPKGISPRRFCHDKVLRLERMDKSPEKELTTTLLQYLSNARSITETAEQMFIHRNTVRYRINRCKEIMHTELESGEECFAFLVSLRILRYMHCYFDKGQS